MRFRSVEAGLVAVLLGAVGVPARGLEQIDLDGYAAKVNDRVITVGDVLMTAGSLDQEARMSAASEAGLKRKLNENYRSSLTRLIERALMLEEAKRRTAENPDREISEKIVNDQVNGVVRDRFDGNRDRFIAALSAEGLTMADYVRQTRERLEIYRIRKSEVLEQLMLSPGRVREAYERRIKEYQTPEEVRLRLLMVQRGQTESVAAVKRAQAERALSRIRSGESFETVVREMSEGPRVEQGGDLGWQKPVDLRKELRDALRELKAGSASGLIDTPDGFYVIQLVARKEPGQRPFEEVRADLEKELLLQEEERVYNEWIGRLRARHYVRVLTPDRPEML